MTKPEIDLHRQREDNYAKLRLLDGRKTKEKHQLEARQKDLTTAQLEEETGFISLGTAAKSAVDKSNRKKKIREWLFYAALTVFGASTIGMGIILGMLVCGVNG